MDWVLCGHLIDLVIWGVSIDWVGFGVLVDGMLFGISMSVSNMKWNGLFGVVVWQV